MRTGALFLLLLAATPAFAEETPSVSDIAAGLTRQTREVSDLMQGLSGAPAAPEAPSALPRIDVEVHCEEVAAFTGGSAEVRNYCIEAEQRAYNTLKVTWVDYAASTQAYCASILEFTPSYEVLAYCLNSEAEAAGARKTFDY